MSKGNAVYPVILTPTKMGFSVYVPDFEKNTQGGDLAEALEMAQDAIEMMGVFWQDEGRKIPSPSAIENIETKGAEIKTLVVADFDGYRRKMETKVVRKAVTIPSWLNVRAEAEGVNFSATLQEALKVKLGV